MDEMNKEEFENTQESIDTSKEQYQGNMGGPVHKEKKKKNPDIWTGILSRDFR